MSSLLAAVVLLSGATACTRTVEPPTPAPSSAAVPAVPADGSVQPLVDQVLLSARRGDRPAYDATLSLVDPVFDQRARQLFENLSGLPLTQLQARLEPDRRPLSTARQQLLGPAAWTQAATVTWRLAGDGAAADHLVWFTFRAEGGGVRLAGLIDRPSDAAAARQPAWWLGPVASGRRAAVTVVTGAGQPLQTWLGRAETTLAGVRRHLPASARRTEDPTLVIEIPATTAAFEQIVGTTAGSYTDVAAVTLAEGAAARAALRIVVNPDATRRLTADGLGLTLVHEGVHVLTRSPESPAPTWAVEGLADWVALRAHPEAGSDIEEPLLREVATHGPPGSLPADAAFEVGAERLDLAYAQAWSVCRYVVSRSDEAGLGRLYAELDRGRRLDQAAPAVLDQSAAELTAGWRRFLQTAAQGR